MIVIDTAVKRFGNFTALHGVSCRIGEGCVYGLVGSNGAGKSTLLRMVSGVYKPDGGSITLDGESVYDNPAVKSKIAFVADELYFLPQSNLKRMAQMYREIYTTFSNERFRELCDIFELPTTKNLAHFSKGMRRQAAIILALAAQPKYLLLDETFDGLDPVKRALVKKVIYDDIVSRNATAIISSHSLRELEDTCDQLALLHNGGIVLEQDVAKLQTELFKVQVAFESDFDEQLFSQMDVIRRKKSGRVYELIVRGDRGQVEQQVRAWQPLLLDLLPLSLEEIFMYEMDALGYAVHTTGEDGAQNA